LLDAEVFYGMGIDTFALVRGELKSEHIKMELDTADIISDNLLNSRTGNMSHKDYRTMFSEASQFEVNRLGRYTTKSINELYDSNFGQYTDYVESGKSVRVLGTEECMYPAIKIGEALENKGHKVVCHATTRSKIDVLNSNSNDSAREITNRETLHSAYSTDRVTYLYNTDIKTDYLLVVTDSCDEEALELFMKDVLDIFGDKVEHIQLVRL
jgi:hypothetical protein